MRSPAPTTKAKLANQAFPDRTLIDRSDANQPKIPLLKYLVDCRQLDDN